LPKWKRMKEKNVFWALLWDKKWAKRPSFI